MKNGSLRVMGGAHDVLAEAPSQLVLWNRSFLDFTFVIQAWGGVDPLQSWWSPTPPPSSISRFFRSFGQNVTSAHLAEESHIQAGTWLIRKFSSESASRFVSVNTRVSPSNVLLRRMCSRALCL